MLQNFYFHSSRKVISISHHFNSITKNSSHCFERFNNYSICAMSMSPYSDRKRENTDRKNKDIRTLFMEWNRFFKLLLDWAWNFKVIMFCHSGHSASRKTRKYGGRKWFKLFSGWTPVNMYGKGSFASV